MANGCQFWKDYDSIEALSLTVSWQLLTARLTRIFRTDRLHSR